MVSLINTFIYVLNVNGNTQLKIYSVNLPISSQHFIEANLSDYMHLPQIISIIMHCWEI